MVTQETIHQKFSHINKISTDAWNRNDQQVRSPCDYMVLELVDLTDKYHPKPVDPLARSFVPHDEDQPDTRKIQIGKSVVNLEEIKSDVAYLTSQDKELCMNGLVSL